MPLSPPHCIECNKPIGEFGFSGLCVWCKYYNGKRPAIHVKESEVTKDILFEYAVVYHGKQTKDEADRNVRVRSKLLKPITAILARDEGEVRLIAGREIPEEYLDRIDQVEVLVVPFA